MKQIPFTLDHINLSGVSLEGMAEVIADFAIESFLENDNYDGVFTVLVNAHTKLLMTHFEAEGIEDTKFLDSKEAASYAAELVYEYTDSYEDSPCVEWPVIHKQLVKRVVIAYLNRMRATMNQLRAMKQ